MAKMQDVLRFKKFCESIKFEIPQSMQQTALKMSDKAFLNDTLSVQIIFADEVKINDYFTLYNLIKNNRNYKISPDFEFDFLQYKRDNLIEFIVFLINMKPKYSKLRQINWVNNLEFVGDYTTRIISIDKLGYNEFSQLIRNLERELREYGFNHLILSPELKEIEFSAPLETIDLKEEIRKYEELSRKNQKNVKQSHTAEKTGFKPRSQRRYQICKIEEINEFEEKSLVEFSGELYEFDSRQTKNGKHIYILSIADGTDAILARWFLTEPISPEVIKKDFVLGNYLRIQGSVGGRTQGKYEGFVFVDNYAVVENPNGIVYDNPNDTKKRVELHICSKFNTMDGIIDPNEVIERAEKLGMSAVAINDLDAVQAYPKFFAAAKKSKVKALYGASYSTFKKNPQVFLNYVPNGSISSTNFVSFDIETTGLSPLFHELIEYGSHSVPVSGQAPEIQQFFLKPKEEIKPFTHRLTGISQKMIDEKGLDYKLGLQKIYDALHNNVALAHNAKFDFNFLKEQFRLHNIEFPNVAVIDTLVVSRLLFPERKKHSLGDLANFLGVKYDPNTAHRADYDAKVLAQVWVELVHEMKLKNITTFADLQNYSLKNQYKDRFPFSISVLARSQAGLKKQFEMISKCLTTNFTDRPKTYFEDIKSDPDLLFGSGTLKSKLLDTYFYSTRSEFEDEIQRYDYIEIPAPQVFKHWVETDFITQNQLEYALKDIILTAKKYNKIPVATGDVRYLDPADKKAFEVLVYANGIGHTKHYLYSYERARENTMSIPDQWFLNTTQMLAQFSFLGDEQLINEVVIENTNKIADMCEEIEVTKKDLYTPKFDDSAVKLKKLVYDTAHDKYGEDLPEIIEKRIEAELTPIIKYGFDVIYWISHKLVKKSLDEGYFVGSRGSVGSSLVATLTNISEVNPIEPYYLCPNCKFFELAKIDGITSAYDLPAKKCNKCNVDLLREGHTIAFETFLGFNADKVPDIDLNFSGDFQSEVHNEVKRLFGESHTLRAGTISTVAFKTGYQFVKNFCEETRKNYSSSYTAYLAKKIEGVKRTTGQHPGGIIIIPKEYDVSDFTPINYPADDNTSSWFTTHFDFKAIHDNVLKLDLLGHDNPTVIKILEKYTGINISQVPKNDKDTFELFSSTSPLGIESIQIGNEPTGALGLPEFGTSFVRQMLTQVKPRSFADLVSVSGLSHGTDVWIDNNQDLIMKQGFKLSEIFSCRDDILAKLVSQGVPNKFAFDIMEKVRKGKGLTKDEEAKLTEFGVPNWQLDSMNKIAYMFPKAHAVAYVLMGYWIGWFKIHYPLAFYASYFATHAKAVDIASMVDVKGGKKAHNKLVLLQSLSKEELTTKDKDLMPTLEITRELYARGLYIANIDLEKSLAHEWLIDNENQCLIPPFKSLDGLGDAVAESIVNTREQKQFTSIEDFASRAKVNKTLIEKLKQIGVFSNIDETDQISLF
ncbi:DNA polymerase III alpha subunit [Mycoplasmopsis californica]|nr:DNA polymerase III alpha subunit [Mycoplasmopsis californica]BBG43022.1 DNA polymerase III alpha subunit [Mycoplasmopsis californica]